MDRFRRRQRSRDVGIRAEDIRIGPDETIEAIAHGVENHGVEKIITLRINDCLFEQLFRQPIRSRSRIVSDSLLFRNGCTASTLKPA